MKKNLAITFAIAIVAIFAIVACSNSVVAKSKVATPEADHVSGYVSTNEEVALSCKTSGATIYYTTDGSTPTTEDTKYTKAIEINEPTTVKAFAVADGYENSDVATYSYAVTAVLAAPTPFPKQEEGGTTPVGTTIYLNSVEGATIEYSTDGIIYEDYPTEGIVLDKTGETKIWTRAALSGYDSALPSWWIYNVTDEESTIKIAGGKFIVHFAEPQEVENHSFSYTDTKDDITIVSYDTCTTAYPVIKDLPVTAALKDWIDVLSLVSVEEGNNQDFALAITTHGGLVNFVRAICAQILNIAECDINVVIDNDGNLTISTTTSPSDLFEELVIFIKSLLKLAPSINGKFGIHLTNNWDGLALSPIYLTEDLYGLLLDLLYGNVRFTKGLADPLTTFAVYKNDGSLVREVTFNKTNANLEYYYDIFSDTLYFANSFYSRETYPNFPVNKQIFDDENNCVRIIDSKKVTDPVYGECTERHYYKNDCGILVSVTDLTTNTDTDWVKENTSLTIKSAIPEIKDNLTNGITYTILTKSFNPIVHYDYSKNAKLFTVNSEKYFIENFMRDYFGVKNYNFADIMLFGKDLISLVMAKQEDSISGFKTTFTSYYVN